VTPPLEVLTWGPDETLELGRRLGTTLRGGEFLALAGPLGAGKTQFVKGVAAGLGVAREEPIVSPTFVLLRSYRGKLVLHHLDAYRLTSAADLWDIGLDELCAQPDAVVALEWCDRVPEVVRPDAIEIVLAHCEEARRVRISTRDVERQATLARALA